MKRSGNSSDGIALPRGSGKQAGPEVSAPANLANWT
jgi:hypothetical protein